MAYFSNGAEGRDYEEQFCVRCVHYGPEEGPGCPVWGAHLLYAYEECNSQSNAKIILDWLIPMDADGWPQQCRMFIPSERSAA